ncbi:SRPBCC family protein [Streptomyces syringium]|uniref:SRPBCC family protein n=1 Tax=Streptomyces syringium TaxID=76729 RepID=UPI003D89DE42
MAERKAAGRATGAAGGLRDRVQGNPGANRLVEEAEAYVQARLEHILEDMVHRLEDSATRLGEAHLGPHALAGAIGKGGRHLKAGASPSAAVLSAVASHAKDTLVEKVKEASGKRRDEKRRGAPSGGRSLTVVEDVEVGVPVREAYDQWTQFQDFGRYAKGVVNVEREDETTSQWHVKIAKASRHWQGTVTEMVPDERIAWTSEGAKGTAKGVVTFHPLAENLTKVLLVMEYFPQGLVEKTGALLRAQGRRTRLDLKLYRTFLTVRGEATGGWRGEIRDGEVVREPDEDAYEQETDDYEPEDRVDEGPRRAEESDEPYEGEYEGEYDEVYEDEEPRAGDRGAATGRTVRDSAWEGEEPLREEEPEDEEPHPRRSRK